MGKLNFLESAGAASTKPLLGDVQGRRLNGGRLPWFELSLILIALIIGWAEYRLVLLRSQADQERARAQAKLRFSEQQAQDRQQEAQELQRRNQQIQNVFTELRTDFTEELEQLRQTQKQEDLTWPETRRLQEEYQATADVVRTNMNEMQAALSRLNLARNTAEPTGFRQRRDEMSRWIQKQTERAQLERFGPKSQAIKARLDQERLTPARAPLTVPLDFAALLNQLSGHYSNYVAETDDILLLNVKKNFFGPEFEKRLKNAGAEAFQVLELAGQAGAASGAIGQFLDQQWQSEKRQRGEHLQPVVQSFLKAEGQLQTNGLLLPARTGNNLAPATPDWAPGPRSYLSAIFPLVVAQLGLGVFLMVALYRRVVVERLRVKLQESAAENKLAHFERLAVWQAHEIKQPLTAINAWLWTLQQSLPAGSPEQSVAGAIRQETDRLDQFVKEYLRLARAMEPKLVPMQAEPALREIQALFQPRLDQQSIALKLEAETERRFRADPQQLKQVLINLVRNAAESIEQQGAITLRARQDRVPLQGRTSDVVVIEVEDTGPGIPPEVQGRLFDPFFSTKKDGTGLGLAIAARIIDRHGGALEFKSSPQDGTTFALVLPAVRNGG